MALRFDRSYALRLDSFPGIHSLPGMNTDTSTMQDHLPVVLTIAGSDSSGGAGIQADLKTITALGAFATSAITCLTAQNPRLVSSVFPIPADMIIQQIKAVCSAFPVAAAKTGMLYSAEIIRAVATADVQEGIPILVVDPVMVAASGTRLLEASAIDALCADLIPQARVITPNVYEAEILCGHPIQNPAELKDAAREIGERYDVACLLKGGHLPGPEVVDILYDEGEAYTFSSPRLSNAETHGAGCVLSAALATFLAQGELLDRAVARAIELVIRGIQTAKPAGRYHPLNLTDHAGGNVG